MSVDIKKIGNLHLIIGGTIFFKNESFKGNNQTGRAE